MKRQTQLFRWIRLVGLASALFAVSLLAIGVVYWHNDAPGSADTCPICHLAHMPTLPGMSAAAFSGSTAGAWIVVDEIRIAHTAPCTLDSPPRAPPA